MRRLATRNSGNGVAVQKSKSIIAPGLRILGQFIEIETTESFKPHMACSCQRTSCCTLAREQAAALLHCTTFSGARVCRMYAYFANWCTWSHSVSILRGLVRRFKNVACCLSLHAFLNQPQNDETTHVLVCLPLFRNVVVGKSNMLA